MLMGLTVAHASLKVEPNKEVGVVMVVSAKSSALLIS